jgi:hypothetical protein
VNQLPCSGLTELFYSERRDHQAQAKRACRGCDARMRCLTTALEQVDQYGVWGGFTAEERVKMRRAVAASATNGENMYQLVTRFRSSRPAAC